MDSQGKFRNENNFALFALKTLVIAKSTRASSVLQG